MNELDSAYAAKHPFLACIGLFAGFIAGIGPIVFWAFIAIWGAFSLDDIACQAHRIATDLETIITLAAPGHKL